VVTKEMCILSQSGQSNGVERQFERDENKAFGHWQRFRS
jgi:hypothetical protein